MVDPKLKAEKGYPIWYERAFFAFGVVLPVFVVFESGYVPHPVHIGNYSSTDGTWMTWVTLFAVLLQYEFSLRIYRKNGFDSWVIADLLSGIAVFGISNWIVLIGKNVNIPWLIAADITAIVFFAVYELLIYRKMKKEQTESQLS